MNDSNASLAATNFSLRSLLLFLAVGGFSTGLHYLVMLLAVLGAGVSVVRGSAAGFALSAMANYLLNARFTFRSGQAHRVGAPRFLVTAGCGLVLNAALLSLLLSAGLHPVPAQMLTTLGVIVWNYCIHGFWTFRTARK